MHAEPTLLQAQRRRVDGVVERVWAKAAQASVDAAMREEERRRWEEAQRRREALEAIRREQLACLEAVEKELILRALKKSNWNQTQAARYLDLSRKTLIYRMEKYGLK